MAQISPDSWWDSLPPRRKKQIQRWVTQEARRAKARERSGLTAQLRLTGPDGLPPGTTKG